jgi:hypothetical protein
MEPVTESKFNMWRACVAAVHIDKVVTPEEKKWVEDKIKSLPFTDEQKKLLNADLSNGADFEEAYKRITDKKDLAFLLNTLRVIAYLDKNFDKTEKESFNKLEAIILKGLDLKKITAEVEELRIKLEAENKIVKSRPGASPLEHLYDTFMKHIS